MKSVLICTFVLIVLAWNFSVLSAYPSTYSADQIDRDVKDSKYIDSTNNYRNSRLRRSFYYDDGYDYSSYPYRPYRTPIRRQDGYSDDIEYKYTPLVRYKARRTERKKLFVPNLFG